MMARRLLLGALLGAALAGWASLFEAIRLYGAFPYHADPLVWGGLLPIHLLVGALGGLLLAPFLGLVTRKSHLQDEIGLHLGLFLLCVGGLAIGIVEARMGLDVKYGTFSGAALGRFVVPLAWAVGAYLVGYRLIRSPLGWTVASLARPVAVSAGLVFLILAAGVSFLLPVRTAQVSDHRSAQAAPASSPNVLFIVLDTLSAQHLGSYGYHRATSPRLDALAGEGAQFQNAFSAAPWTLPSHASMFTGLLPNLHGTGWQRPRLSDGQAAADELEAHDYHTLAEELAMRGYDTVGVAEKSWISHTAGLTQGFHTVFDYSQPSLADGFLVMRFWNRYRDKFGMPAPRVEDKGGARVVDTALDWLDGHRTRDERRPFFMFMNLNEAHDPYLPPAEFKGHFRPAEATDQDFADLKPHNTVSSHRDVIMGDFTPSPLQWEIYKSLYDDEILYQDMLLGRLFDGLVEQGLMEETLIVVTSDHGEEFGELSHRLGHQLSLSDRLLHVPLIMRYPERIPAGQRLDAMASTIDIFPTVLDLVEQEQGMSWPKSGQEMAIQGVSQLGTMQGGPPARDFVMAHYFNPTPYLTGFEQWDWEAPDGALPPEVAITLRSIDVIRTADGKLYLYGDGQRAFVRLADDPTEQSSEAPEIAADDLTSARLYERRFHLQLNSAVSAYEKWVGHFAWYRTEVKGAAAAKAGAVGNQQMEQLGYVGDAGGADAVDLGELESIQLPPFFRLRD
jgi:arylsulfatase A-like enzyme